MHRGHPWELEHFSKRGKVCEENYVLTSVVDMRFNVPVSVNIARPVLLDTGGLDLLETPLWEVDIAST